MGSSSSKKNIIYEELSEGDEKPVDGYQPDLGFVGYGLNEDQSLQSLEKYLSLFFNIVIRNDKDGYFIKTKKYGRMNIHVHKVGSIYKSYLDK